MASLALWAFNFFAAAAGIASLIGWVLLGRRSLRLARPLLAAEARRVPFWSLAEFFLGFGLWLVCSTAAVVTVRKYWGSGEGDDWLQLDATGFVALAIAGGVANLLVLACLMVQMGLTSSATLRRYGFWPRRSDLLLSGVVAFLVIPPVLLVADLLGRVVEYEHEVLDAIQREPTFMVFFSMAVGTIVIAPLLEEFLFRALLQGGAQRAARAAVVNDRGQETNDRQESAKVSDLPTESEASEIGDTLPIPATEVAGWPWWPILLSSGLFAVMHIGQGAAPIPLFLFSVAMGYVYRQTGRLWPCILVHALLNAFSMVGFGLQMLTGD